MKYTIEKFIWLSNAITGISIGVNEVKTVGLYGWIPFVFGCLSLWVYIIICNTSRKKD